MSSNIYHFRTYHFKFDIVVILNSLPLQLDEVLLKNFLQHELDLEFSPQPKLTSRHHKIWTLSVFPQTYTIITFSYSSLLTGLVPLCYPFLTYILVLYPIGSSFLVLRQFLYVQGSNLNKSVHQ